MIALIDRKFRANKLRYVSQSVLATVSTMFVLLMLDFFSNAAIIAALGASSFIVYAMPHANVSKPRYLLGGYLVGVVVGSGCYWLAQIPTVAEYVAVGRQPQVVFGAVAVGLAIFLMTVTNTEHPPAAGVALGLVMGEWQVRTVAVIAAGVVALVVIKTMLKPVLMNLVDTAPHRPPAGLAHAGPTAGEAGTEGDEP